METHSCDRTTILIFGASGDLTWRKLIPALYHNFRKGRLSECAHVVGFARRPYTNDSLREYLKEGVLQFSPEVYNEGDWAEFSSRITYFQGDLDAVGDYLRLESYLNSLEEGPANRLYYLATAPEHYPLVVKNLGSSGMARASEQAGQWRRVVVEKPFGHDLETARELNQVIHQVFDESQVYRIDHYLGKETAQNILFFRFANTIFEPVWNRRYINNIQITVAETVDVGHRAGYYDSAGVLRDMFQNHLLSLLSLVAMEAPSSFRADAVRNEKAKVLESIRPIKMSDTVRAQYEGYCSLAGVKEGSVTPTFAALKLFIDNWRWQDVPFYLRSGKAMARKTSEIIIEFQQPPHLLFHLPPGSNFSPNILSLFIQPDEGIHLRFEVKKPDSEQDMHSVLMDFHYRDSFSNPLPDAYERLLLDALAGDPSLFTRSDAIEYAWKMMDPVLLGWDHDPFQTLETYTAGSWGPAAADDLLERDGRQWHTVDVGEEQMIHAGD